MLMPLHHANGIACFETGCTIRPPTRFGFSETCKGLLTGPGAGDQAPTGPAELPVEQAAASSVPRWLTICL